MCYNVYIMKKYCFLFIAAMLFVSVFSSCTPRKSVATVIYDDVPSPLTQVTTTIHIPEDTYSEYMATYTPPTTTGTDVYYYHLPNQGGINADTGAGTYILPDAPDNAAQPRDTAATRVTAESVSETGGTVTSVPEESESSEITLYTETAATYIFDKPHADTGFYPQVSADTAPTTPSVTSVPSESTDTENESSE